MKSRTKKINGVTHILCGGYVSYKTRNKDDYGFHKYRTLEVQVWMPACDESGEVIDYTDCGYNTDQLDEALKAKVAKRFKNPETKGIYVSECWEY